jgi:TatD DNase family protein
VTTPETPGPQTRRGTGTADEPSRCTGIAAFDPSYPLSDGAKPHIRWTDDHCHLHFRDAAEADVDELVADARSAGVERFVTVGCDVADSRAAIAVAERVDGVFATAGVHPHEAVGGLDGLVELLAHPSVVAVGECGLDFHYDHSPRDAQREVFAAQIALAHGHDLALVIHTRSAWPETFDVLAAEGVPERTVFHCFTGGPEEARRCLDLGAHLSISGIVTFPSAQDIRDAVALCPPERLLVETDTPYLAPVPHRGQRNRPGWVPVVGAAVAEVQGRSVEDVAASTWEAAARLYRLPPP